MNETNAYSSFARLDSELLRTFLAVADTGSFTAAAERIFRSQSAASVQIKRLEDIVGEPVFIRHGRGVNLSPMGERLEPLARQVVQALDSGLAGIRGQSLAGRVRVGIPDDDGRARLTDIVSAFAARHPDVELDVRCALSATFPEALRRGDIDIAVFEVERVAPGMQLLSTEVTVWAASREHAPHLRSPLPVALFDRDCWWRVAAIRSLEALNRPYRIVFSSESVNGIMSGIDAGVAIGLVNESWLHDGLIRLGPEHGFGPTPASNLVIDRATEATGDAVDAMAAAITRAFNAPS